MEEIKTILLNREPPILAPGDKVFDESLVDRIESLPQSKNVRAGLHLLNDDIHHAHLLAQSIEGDPIADYWHAILHRREKDYSNSKYWFSHVNSDVLKKVYGQSSISLAKQKSFAFVDQCEKVKSGRDSELEHRQFEEMKSVLEAAIKRE
ncbi:MiaA [Acrasis kona]|uniref:MiaA n=1 Tax=Acrasis kona TaxID=1008807 RepID=A0AAW2ZGL1_9EUKA